MKLLQTSASLTALGSPCPPSLHDIIIGTERMKEAKIRGLYCQGWAPNWESSRYDSVPEKSENSS